ncbi:protein phosphatase [Lithospermum erythrorhizon]|uniref:protein-serine/threonine phosphatase n=1 Tax=Lithospermum erythrorhizon TaxID=34254 RepID=A0AAV3NJJ1_LITER
MLPKSEHQSVPLSVLLKRELANEKTEKPELSHGQAGQSKKGEDFTLIKTECQRVLGDGVTTFSVFGLFDGHNGSAAAIYTKENLLKNVMGAIPSDLNTDEWLAALPRALVAGFVKTDKDFQERARTSGTTVTFAIIEGWVVTVASVGDSRCILESAEGDIYHLSADHRLECNEEERDRITSSGGEVGRLNTGGGTEIGPLRCWPGGLCLSRSIGDMDVGEFIVPVPYVKQVKLSSAGGRLIIASDGVWDALSSESAVECCRGMSPDAAASEIVEEAVQVKGLRDDTTCIVIDVQPPAKPNLQPPPPPKKHGKGVFKGMFRKKPSEAGSQSDIEEYSEPDFVEELFEEGSASLAERLDSKYPVCNMFKLFICAVCQAEIKPGFGISLQAESLNTTKFRPWDGPFLCSSCQDKKEAMEGKKSSGGLPYLTLTFHLRVVSKWKLNLIYLFITCDIYTIPTATSPGIDLDS